ncbi:MAG: KTSC domain-containing protein [Edaphobacter sp.]
MPSSVIAAMSYNADTQVLTLVYRGNQGTYRYFDVPPEEYDAFRSASSKGTYLNTIFKAKQYRYERKRHPSNRNQISQSS